MKPKGNLKRSRKKIDGRIIFSAKAKSYRSKTPDVVSLLVLSVK